MKASKTKQNIFDWSNYVLTGTEILHLQLAANSQNRSKLNKIAKKNFPFTEKELSENNKGSEIWQNLREWG